MNIRKHFYEDDAVNQPIYQNNEDINDNDVPSRLLSHDGANDQPSILRRNFIYISMFIIIIVAIFLNNYDMAMFLKDNLDIDVYKYDFFKKPDSALNVTNTEGTKTDLGLGNEHYSIDKFKENYIYPYYWVLLISFLLITIFVFYLFAHHLQQEQNINIKNESEMEDQIKSDPYLIRQSTYQYEQLKDYYTRRELEKLYNSEQFKQMRREKGEEITNWNWQLKEKEIKDVYREKGTESEDISHLSLSD